MFELQSLEEEGFVALFFFAKAKSMFLRLSVYRQQVICKKVGCGIENYVSEYLS